MTIHNEITSQTHACTSIYYVDMYLCIPSAVPITYHLPVGATGAYCGQVTLVQLLYRRKKKIKQKCSFSDGERIRPLTGCIRLFLFSLPERQRVAWNELFFQFC